jgi:hypothetical protein
LVDAGVAPPIPEGPAELMSEARAASQNLAALLLSLRHQS